MDLHVQLMGLTMQQLVMAQLLLLNLLGLNKFDGLNEVYKVSMWDEYSPT